MGGKLFVICNTLIEKVAKVDESFLKKFNVPKGDSLYISDELLVKEIDSLLSYAQVFSGGSGANMAHGAANLGMQVTFAGTVGDDAHAEHFKMDFLEIGVQAFLATKKQMHGVVYILITPDNERSFIVVRGASYDYAPCHLPLNEMQTSEFFHTTGYALSFPLGGASHALESAKALNIFCSLDLSSPYTIRSNKESIQKALQQTTLLFISKEEATAFGFSDSSVIEYMHTYYGIPFIAYKMGKDGAIMSEKGKKTFIPAHTVSVVSETGAGDAFAAGVIYGLSEQKSFEQAGQIGASYAAQVIGQLPSRLFHKGREKKCSQNDSRLTLKATQTLINPL